MGVVLLAEWYQFITVPLQWWTSPSCAWQLFFYLLLLKQLGHLSQQDLHHHQQVELQGLPVLNLMLRMAKSRSAQCSENDASGSMTSNAWNGCVWVLENVLLPSCPWKLSIVSASSTPSTTSSIATSLYGSSLVFNLGSSFVVGCPAVSVPNFVNHANKSSPTKDNLQDVWPIDISLFSVKYLQF